MGVDYDSVIFIGYKIQKEKLVQYEYKTTQIKSLCNCTINNDNFKFCPNCGNVNNKIITDTIEHKYLESYEIYDCSNDYHRPNEYVYVCLKLYRSEKYNKEPQKCQFNIPEIDKIKLMEEVKKIEIWNDDNYGIYNFLEIS